MPEKRSAPGDTWKKVLIEPGGSGVAFVSTEQVLQMEEGSTTSWDQAPLEDVCSAMLAGTFPSARPESVSAAARLMADTARRDLDRPEPDWGELDRAGRTVARMIAGEPVSDD